MPTSKRVVSVPSLSGKGVNVPDPDATVIIQGKNGYTHHYKPTRMQLKAEYYRQMGYNKREAMKKAGYKMSHTGSDKPFSPALHAYVNATMQEQLRKKGLTEEKIAEKMLEWLDAKKTTVTKDGKIIETPDTFAQIKGYQEIDKVIHLSGETPQAGVKRKMTLEEWTYGDDPS